MNDVEKVMFPNGFVAKPGEDGSTVITVGDTRKEEKIKKSKKENDEVRKILFKAAEEDVGRKYFLYVYKITDMAGNRSLKLTIPLDQLEDDDVEKYVKDRVSGEKGGTTYLCYVKDQSGQIPSNRDVKDICMRFVFDEDGEIYLKDKKEKEKEREDVMGNVGDTGVHPNEMVKAIRDAVNVGVAAAGKQEPNNSSDKMFELVGTLAKAAADKPQPVIPPTQESSVVKILEVLAPVLAPLLVKVIEPKNDASIEILRGLAESTKELAKTIAETNNKIAEQERRIFEERYKDKAELMLMIKETSAPKDGSAFMGQAVQMMEMSNKMNNVMLASVMGMFKNAMEINNSLSPAGKGQSDGDGKPVWQVLVDRLLDPASWKHGIEAVNSMKNGIKNDNEFCDNAETAQTAQTENFEEVPESEDVGMADTERGLLNTLMEDILGQVNKGVKNEEIVNNVVSTYSPDRKDDMRSIIKKIESNFSDCAKMLNPKLIPKAAFHLSKLQEIMMGIRSNLGE